MNGTTRTRLLWFFFIYTLYSFKPLVRWLHLE